MRPLDIVKTKKGALAIVQEISSDGSIAIEFIGASNAANEKNAWWDDGELTVIDSIPWILSRTMAHPFGDGHKQAKRIFGVKANKKS